jgi:hypothetical protein
VIVHGKDERYFHDGTKTSLEQAAPIYCESYLGQISPRHCIARMEKEALAASVIVSVIPDSRYCEPTGIIIAIDRLDSIHTASDPSE